MTMFWRAFRKPLAFAVDAVYGNSIDLGLEVITKKGLAQVMRFEMGNWFYEHGVGIVYITRPSRLRTRIGGQDAR